MFNRHPELDSGSQYVGVRIEFGTFDLRMSPRECKWHTNNVDCNILLK